MKLGDFTGIRGIPNQDIPMWETMGAIADRTKERLGASDLAVVEFRRLMVDAARDDAEGRPGARLHRAAHPACEHQFVRARSAQERGLADFRHGGGERIVRACARTGRLMQISKLARSYSRDFAVIDVAGLAAARAAEPYKINVILPLTGGASFLGRGEQQALQIFQAVINKDGGINGEPLEFTFYDDQTSPQTAVQMANGIIAAKPAVILGSSIVAMCNAIAPLLKDGPFDYCLSPGVHPAVGSYQYSSNTDTHALIQALVRYYRMRGLTRIGFISSTDATGQDAERGLNEVLKLPENAGVQIVERQRFNPTDVSVAAQLERIKGAEPQALIAWSTGAPIATVFKGILAAGLNVPVGVSNGNQTYAQMTQYKDFLPKDLYVTTSLFLPHEGMFQLDPRVEEQQKKMYAAFSAANDQARRHVGARLGPRPHHNRSAAAVGNQGDSRTSQAVRRWPNELSGDQRYLRFHRRAAARIDGKECACHTLGPDSGDVDRGERANRDAAAQVAAQVGEIERRIVLVRHPTDRHRRSAAGRRLCHRRAGLFARFPRHQRR